MDYADIKENCKVMIMIINKLQYAEKGELGDLENIFDTYKEDLIKSLKEEW